MYTPRRSAEVCSLYFDYEHCTNRISAQRNFTNMNHDHAQLSIKNIERSLSDELERTVDLMVRLEKVSHNPELADELRKLKLVRREISESLERLRDKR